MGNHLFDAFPIRYGLIQRALSKLLSASLYNSLFGKSKRVTGQIATEQTHQLLIYADDVNSNASTEAGLEINADKTKYH
jgi:hypothetical protein